jgi:uncharacterized protein HemX
VQNNPIKPEHPPTTPSNVSKTTSTPDFRADIVKTYQEAGQVGVLLLTIVLITITSGWVILRALKMYASLSEKQLQLSETRISAFEKMALSISELTRTVQSMETKVENLHQSSTSTSAGSDRQRRPSNSRIRDREAE